MSYTPNCPVYYIESSQTHRRELTYHYNGRSRTVPLTGRGDYAALTRACAELLSAGRLEAPDGFTGRHPGDWGNVRRFRAGLDLVGLQVCDITWPE